MALEGADKDEEDKLLARVNRRRWYLNENLMKEFESVDCDRCLDYVAHVATDFGSGEGSLKATSASEVAQLREDNHCLEAANEMADLLDTKVTKELENVREEKSSLDQQIGQIREQLEDAHNRRRDAEDEADDLRDANDELRDKIRHLSALLDETDYVAPEENADHEMGEIPNTNTHAGMPAIPYSDQVMAKYAADTASAGMNAGVGKAAERALQSKAPEGAGKPLAARLNEGRGTATTTIHFSNCVVPPPPGLMDEVDAKGFPADVETWNIHCVQQTALEDFYMMDWYCDILRKLARVKDATNAEKNRLLSLKRDDLPYDPKTRALLMQFREVHDVAGCGFVDKCWTLDLCLVCGLALLESLEKLIIELFATPDSIARACIILG
ncbi:hypothetical protein B0H17DRAFT_1205242 [Mycena rosella]|uniref:Uncharacterized protein n=1 Tax=Mycena rosella TaxID=1033263 RepID=A0AAD7D8W2_MYCRO|nr:hypothetical protein B0H17DRAFT_1205242 [Mycena rosella]